MSLLNFENTYSLSKFLNSWCCINFKMIILFLQKYIDIDFFHHEVHDLVFEIIYLQKVLFFIF